MMPNASAAQEGSQYTEVNAENIKDFYRAIKSHKALPKRRDSGGKLNPLYAQMDTIRRRCRPCTRLKQLNENELHLLALLHIAGYPVLGDDMFGKISVDATSGLWRWEFSSLSVQSDDHENAKISDGIEPADYIPLPNKEVFFSSNSFLAPWR